MSPNEVKLFFAAKGVIEKDGRVLLVREGGQYRDGTNAGKWDIVGGRLEAGESVKDGLLREIKEEVGLEVEAEMKPLALGEWWPEVRGEKWHVIANIFACSWVSGEVVLSEDHDEFKWVEPYEWQALPLAGSVGEVLKAYWAR